MANEVALSEREEAFIESLVETGGNMKAVSEITGYNIRYCYLLRKKLARHIVEAAQQVMALNSVKAAFVVTEHMDKDMPNPIHLQAANSVLDRVGIIKKDYSEDERPVIKQNIFILPEKRFIEIIDNERS